MGGGGPSEIRRKRPNSPRRPRANSPPPPRNCKGARPPKNDGPTRRNHGESPPPNTTFTADPSRGWESSGAMRHARESSGPALVCAKKAAVDPSVSATRARKRAPLIGAGRPALHRPPWRREIMDNPPNRHCARRPSPRSLLGEEGPLFPAPLPRRRGGPWATKIGGKRTHPYPLLGLGKRLCRCAGEWPRFRPVPPLELATAESTASEIGRPFPRFSFGGGRRGSAPAFRGPPIARLKSRVYRAT